LLDPSAVRQTSLRQPIFFSETMPKTAFVSHLMAAGRFFGGKDLIWL
jgi:hypothetical protein